jgi:hypothetical protein
MTRNPRQVKINDPNIGFFPHYVNRSFTGSQSESWQLQMSAGDKFLAIIMGAGLVDLSP